MFHFLIWFFKEHPFWVVGAQYFRGSKAFTYNEGGKGWVNEIEGLINQKCPEADLRIENGLTNDLFRYSDIEDRREEVGGGKELFNHRI